MRRLALVLILLLAAGCDLAEDDYRPQLVVDATLVAGQSLGPIRLSQTAPIGVPYSFEAFAVSGATVEVSRLNDAGEVARRIFYHETQPGVYVPEAHATVAPLRRYRLTVRPPESLGLVPSGDLVRAETLVPDTFRVVVAPSDTVAYNVFAPPAELRVSRSAYPGRQAIYLFSIQALEPARYGLTPTYAEFVDPEDALDVTSGTSPLLNEQSYTLNPDGTLTLTIPWLAIRFYGPNRLTASALDEALYDYIRSRDAQFAPTTLSPGEIPEVLSNVENGVGVFGSAAQVSVVVFMRPPVRIE